MLLVDFAVGLLVAGYALTFPHALYGMTEYDDGVYFGAALRLTQGLVPYRDFVLVQPPGLPLLLAPFALVAREIGTRDGLAAVRCVTAVVAGLNAMLAGLVVREKGLAAAFIAGISLACFPYALAATHTAMLEPYLVCFCLLGTAVIFPRLDGVAPRAFLGGVLFGVAFAVKYWALLAFVPVALVATLPSFRRLGRVCAGFVVGFGLLTLPFALQAPRAFVRETILSQLGRGASGLVGADVRLSYIFGFVSSPLARSANAFVDLAEAAGVLLVLALALAVRVNRRLDYAAPLAFVCIVVAFLKAHEFWIHYAYFSAAYASLCIAIGFDRARVVLRAVSARWFGGPRPALGAPLSLVVLAGFSSVAGFCVRNLNTSDVQSVYDPAPLLETDIPAGTCVVTDWPAVLIESDRFISTEPRCPTIVDPYGIGLSVSGPDATAQLNGLWEGYFGKATFVVLMSDSDTNGNIPWNQTLTTWFERRFAPIANTDNSLWELKHPPKGVPDET